MNNKSEKFNDQSSSLLLTDNLEDFLEAAATNKDKIIVLRGQDSVSREKLHRYINILGGQHTSPFGKIWLIKYEPSVKNSTALSLESLQYHTDGAFLNNPPTRFMLSFVRSDPGGGGVSTFILLKDLLAVSPDWAIEALTSAKYLFPRTYDGDLGDSFVGPVLSRSHDGTLHIRWRSDKLHCPKVIDSNGTNAEEAIRWLQIFLKTHEPIKYFAGTGETILIPNTTVLHGRHPPIIQFYT